MNANISIKITALITLLFTNREYYTTKRRVSFISHYR